MVAILKAILIFGFLLLGGCTGVLLQGAMNKGDNLTPEQIEAYNKVGGKVYSCFQIAGPPPAGGTTILVVPKEAPVTVKFLPNCMLQMP